jgi:hypothetical protein
MQSDSYTLQGPVEEQDGELGSSDDSSVHSELSQSLLQGKLYLSNINISIQCLFFEHVKCLGLCIHTLQQLFHCIGISIRCQRVSNTPGIIQIKFVFFVMFK